MAATTKNSKKATETITFILIVIGAIIFLAVLLYFLLGSYSSGVSTYVKTYILPFGGK